MFSRTLPSRTPRERLAFRAAVCALAAVSAVRADTVERRDGGRIDGTIVSVDARDVLIDTPSGPRRLPRSDVASITFGAPPAPPLKIEIRNVKSDDAVEVFLEGESVLSASGETGSWVDITPKLKEGNNALRLRIRNDRATWAYRLSLRINGVVTPLSCGTPLRREDPCRCCGFLGTEIGDIDIPPVWLHVDRELGRAEVLP